MNKKLKMFMRGKGVSMLQELLQRMGYPMNDQPGIFGVSTRDAVKDFQSKKGLKTTGIVDEELLNMIRQNCGIQADTKRAVSESVPLPALGPVDQKQLEVITRLLIKKGIFSEDELRDEMSRPQPVRITQAPLV
ncbi:Putative peptidoglycan binding domain-containing protein [Mariprofundus aestuarium]|uniref:Peptidoglycan binding domain-containing protein n=1 Tax=Mariprofundus aestuarium TaxID=1921086 RepID=A0A2K8L1E9_MARES|nr:peptidoglycan-binding domain-containing protein [Mariprofundus aestuarium]ATX79641.1 Putative peptidoglycan binding domain-containing protein [Mariprofundus aestuarium]